MRPFRKLIKLANGARLATTLLALWKLFKHPDTPWAPRLVSVAVLAYALSPIDLVPDFIPVLGLLDELVLIPMGLALAVRLTPPALWQARLAEAEAGAEKLPRLLWGAALIVMLWLLLLGALGVWLWSLLAGPGSVS
ncbi:MAG TPA: YkvA family protein [Burkholderiaceae bacterium]